MTYKVEQFVAIIESPVVALIEDKQLEYVDGNAFAETSFSKLFRIESLTARGNKVFVKLVENDSINDITWSGEDQTYF